MRTAILGTGALWLCVTMAWGQTGAIQYQIPSVQIHQNSIIQVAQSAWTEPPSIRFYSREVGACAGASRTLSHQATDDWSTASFIGERPFFVDHACFIAKDRSHTYVEFYIQVGYDHLQFTRNGNLYQAVYEIDLLVENREGNLVKTQSARDTIRVADYDETRASDSYRICLLISYLRPGDYRLRAIITDKETDKSAEVAQNFSVRDFSGHNLTISDLQFSRRIEIDSSASPFVKHHRRIEPNVLHAYGQSVSQLFFYYEIYNLANPSITEETNKLALNDSAASIPSEHDSLYTTLSVKDEKGQEVKQRRRVIRKPGNSCVQSWVMPLADLPSGQYTLSVQVFDKQSGHSAEASGRFSAVWPLYSFKDYEFDEILNQLRYIASEQELKVLSTLPTNMRQQGLIEYWRNLDPTPGTPRNEAMEEYYRRIQFANEHFKWSNGKGWKSPQGKIYITYGPPDEIKRYVNPSLGGSNDSWMRPLWPSVRQDWYSSQIAARQNARFENRPYEIWEYRPINRRFVFVDVNGWGIYELIEPSLVDDPWMQ